MIRSVCVFCGSREGADPRYREAATRFGALAGQAGLEVVYGGGRIGLMGAAADAAMAQGGRVTGLIPTRLLSREVAHDGISELIVTDGMFDRKAEMITRSDAFVVLPGGLGTLDELLEVITLRQLGYHEKPILLVDIGGYWDPFLALVARVVEEAFAAPSASDLFEVVDGVDAALMRLVAPAEAAVAAD